MIQRHAAALALVEWYLMMPPTQEMLDSSCSDRGIVYYLTTLISKETEADRIKRCDREAIVFVPDTKLSLWPQGDEFETLAECRAEKSKPPTEQDRFWTDLAADLSKASGVTKEELSRSADEASLLSVYCQ
jgi:hypothetical protein